MSQAARRNLTFTHGVAAKLINCYLKSRFVCGRYLRDGPGEDPRDGVLGGDTANTGNC